jgi:hypothetical protein
VKLNGLDGISIMSMNRAISPLLGRGVEAQPDPIGQPQEVLPVG